MLVYQRVSQILCTIHSSIPYRPRLHHRRHANFRTSVATPSRSPMDKGTSRILKWRVLDPHKSQKKYEKISKIGHQTISNSSNISQISKSSNRPAVTIKVMMRVWLPHRQPQWQSTTSQHVPGIPDGSARLVAPSRTSRRCSSCTPRRWRKRPSHCYLQKSPEKSWRNDTNFDPGSSDTKGHLSTWALDWRQTVSPDSKLVAMAAMAAMALSDPTGDSKPGEGVFPAVAGLRES